MVEGVKEKAIRSNEGWPIEEVVESTKGERSAAADESSTAFLCCGEMKCG